MTLDFEPREIAYGEGAVWVCSADRSRLIRIDPQTNEIAAQVDLRGLQIPEHVFLTLAAGEGALWLTDQTSVIQIDLQTRRIVGERLPAGEEIIVAGLGHGSLWTGSHDDGIVARVEAASHRVLTSFDFVGSNLAAGGGSVWVAPAARDSGQPTGNDGIVRIDERTNQVVETIHVGNADTSDYYSVYFRDGFLWVMIDGARASLVQIQPAPPSAP